MWSPLVDANGYTYYLNTITGDTAWEIPSTPESTSSTWEFGGVDDSNQFYFVNTFTGERVYQLPTESNASSTTQSVIHEEDEMIRVEMEIHECVNDLVALVDKNLQAWVRRKQRNAKVRKKKGFDERIRQTRRYEASSEYKQRQSELQEETTREDIEREIVRIKDRFNHRQTRAVQKALAAERTRVRQYQIDLRQEMTKMLMHRASNGMDVHGKINLTNQLDMDNTHKKTLYENEEAIAEREHARHALERLFVSMDPSQYGKISALHVLYCLGAPLNAQASALKRKGLELLASSSDVQKLFLNIGLVDMNMFVYFVDTTEEISTHIEHIKAAIEDAGLGIVSPELATWENSIANVKTYKTIMHPNRKIISLNRLVQSFNSTKTSLLNSLANLLKLRQSVQDHLWEHNHKHIYIQMSAELPVYCCLCRRNRYRLRKLDRYEGEDNYRQQWGRYLSHRMTNVETQLKLRMHSANFVKPIEINSEVTDPLALRWDSSRNDVLTLLKDMVGALVLIHSNNQQTFDRPNPYNSKLLLQKLTKAREDFERQEFERSCLFEEDEASFDAQEWIKIALEDPLVHIQESGHREFLKLSQACTIPSIYLQRLHYNRLLCIRPKSKQLVLRMYDSATSSFCILHPLRCPSDQEANYILQQAHCIEKSFSTTYIVPVKHAFTCMYQQFATNGNLNECWPVAFVAFEDIEMGEYLTKASWPLQQTEVLSIMTSVAAALASLHSKQVLHLNLLPSNLYRTTDNRIKVGGILVFKAPYSASDLSRGFDSIVQLMNPSIVPPEAAQAKACVNEKTDIWALGCLLYFLMTGAADMCKLKPLSLIMTAIPLRYGSSLRACLRMLLQPNPRHRPTAMETFSFLSLAAPEDSPLPTPSSKTKSTPALEPLPMAK